MQIFIRQNMCKILEPLIYSKILSLNFLNFCISKLLNIFKNSNTYRQVSSSVQLFIRLGGPKCIWIFICQIKMTFALHCTGQVSPSLGEGLGEGSPPPTCHIG